MEKVLVLTGADEKMKDVLNLTIPSKLKYANKWGYDFLTINNFRVYSQYNMDKRHLGFSRFIYALELLNYYDFVMWIDGDAIITNDNYSIHDFMINISNNKNNFFFSSDWMHNPQNFPGGHSYFSSGNFILKSSQETEFLAENFLHIAQYHLDDIMQEQGTLNHMSFLPEFKDYFKILHQKYLNSVPIFVSQTEIWKDRLPIFYPWNEDCFLAHFTGTSNEDRINIIKNNFKKFI